MAFCRQIICLKRISNQSNMKKIILFAIYYMIIKMNSYDIQSVYLCCTVGIPMLHTWCQIAALFVPDSCSFLAPFFC